MKFLPSTYFLRSQISTGLDFNWPTNAAAVDLKGLGLCVLIISNRFFLYWGLGFVSLTSVIKSACLRYSTAPWLFLRITTWLSYFNVILQESHHRHFWLLWPLIYWNCGLFYLSVVEIFDWYLGYLTMLCQLHSQWSSDWIRIWFFCDLTFCKWASGVRYSRRSVATQPAAHCHLAKTSVFRNNTTRILNL